MKVTVGVDVGGTFTDVVLVDSDGAIHASKVVTTPHDPRDGVRHGVEVALATAGLDGSAVERFVHGTTLATNVLLERRGARAAFVTTAGFGDMLRLGRATRVGEARYDLLFPPPSPPVDDDMTFEVHERMTASGVAHLPLTDAHVAEVVERIAAGKPEAVAICFLHAYANPAHEEAFAAACRAAMPGAFVVSSAETWPEMREFERATTALACAYVGPVMASYLTGLQQMLRELGVVCPVQIMESSGGVLTAALAARKPVATIESGGAAGVMAAGFVGRLLGERDVLSFDMGGTTAKAAVVRGGEPTLTFDFKVGGHASGGDRRNEGLAVKTPVVDLAEIGAGGGSLAWVDRGGALQVGPRSAGAVPGPACYGRGGTQPAVTDANLILGYLHAGELSDGVVLSPERAAAAIDEHVGGPLGMGTVEAARAIHDIVNNNMVAAIRMVTIQRGIDPRDFALVGFGGAGPIHLVRLAEAFGIRRVVVPWAAGVASALGLVAADPSVIELHAHLVAADDADPAVLTRIFDDLAARAVESLGVSADGVVFRRVIEARYPGQVHQLAVEVPDGALTRADLDAAVTRFHELYLETYGIDTQAPVQFVTMRVRAVVPVEKPEPLRDAPASYRPDAVGARPVFFGEHGEHRTVPVYRWEDLRPGAGFTEPAIIEGAATSVVVPPSWTVTVDTMRNVVLTRG
jgi:N-methylhydantoinase A